MRNSFVLYTSYQDKLKLLSFEQKGILLTAVFAYAAEQELPDMDGVTQMAFAFIKADLDRDAKKYERVCETRREAGKRGGRPKANGFDEKQKKAKKANGFFEKQKNPDNDDDNDNDLKETPTKVGAKKSGFQPPTPQEVTEYVSEKGYTVDAERFCDFYESKGWYVGKNKMKDWKAAVRSWSRSQRQEMTAKGTGQEKTAPARRFANFPQRQYDFDDLERKLLGVQAEGMVNNG